MKSHLRWLDSILHRQPRNPEEYERVRCDLCGGSGLWLQEHNLTDPKLVGYYRGGHCPRCHGEGWLEVKRDVRE